MRGNLVRRVYWDACAFLGLLNKEAGRHSEILAVWREAESGRTLIHTSFLTFVEVFKVKVEGNDKPLAEAKDRGIEAMLSQSFITGVVVDESIGVAARRVMRRFPACRKPTDGVHLARALRLNVDEMHTYDKKDLIALSGQVHRADGRPLIICTPHPLPPPPPPRNAGPDGDDLLKGLEKPIDDRKGDQNEP